MHIKINGKKFQGISNFAISSADLQGILAPEESINWKYYFQCSHNYNSKTCLHMRIFLTFVQVQGQENLQNTTVNINLYKSLIMFTLTFKLKNDS